MPFSYFQETAGFLNIFMKSRVHNIENEKSCRLIVEPLQEFVMVGNADSDWNSNINYHPWVVVCYKGEMKSEPFLHLCSFRQVPFQKYYIIIDFAHRQKVGQFLS